MTWKICGEIDLPCRCRFPQRLQVLTRAPAPFCSERLPRHRLIRPLRGVWFWIRLGKRGCCCPCVSLALAALSPPFVGFFVAPDSHLLPSIRTIVDLEVGASIMERGWEVLHAGLAVFHLADRFKEYVCLSVLPPLSAQQ